jgi:hypothetical protein
MNPHDTYAQFDGKWQENAQVAWDTINLRPTRGLSVGGFGINDMQWSHLAEISGNPPGSYEKEPVRVYPENPLSMREHGYDEDAARGATTGAEEIVRDGIKIGNRSAPYPASRRSAACGRSEGACSPRAWVSHAATR